MVCLLQRPPSAHTRTSSSSRRSSLCVRCCSSPSRSFSCSSKACSGGHGAHHGIPWGRQAHRCPPFRPLPPHAWFCLGRQAHRCLPPLATPAPSAPTHLLGRLLLCPHPRSLLGLLLPVLGILDGLQPGLLLRPPARLVQPAVLQHHTMRSEQREPRRRGTARGLESAAQAGVASRTWCWLGCPAQRAACCMTRCVAACRPAGPVVHGSAVAIWHPACALPTHLAKAAASLASCSCCRYRRRFSRSSRDCTGRSHRGHDTHCHGREGRVFTQ